MKRSIIYLLIGLAIFVGLVLYNYFSAQKAISMQRPSILRVDTLSFPNTVISGQPASFTWQVQAPADLNTDLTTIYWGYDSSPSALKTYDSPKAVGYSGHIADYDSGLFRLPYTFSATAVFPDPGKIYFRSYAHIGDQNIWSPEQSLQVIP